MNSVVEEIDLRLKFLEKRLDREAKSDAVVFRELAERIGKLELLIECQSPTNLVAAPDAVKLAIEALSYPPPEYQFDNNDIAKVKADRDHLRHSRIRALAALHASPPIDAPHVRRCSHCASCLHVGFEPMAGDRYCPDCQWGPQRYLPAAPDALKLAEAVVEFCYERVVGLICEYTTPEARAVAWNIARAIKAVDPVVVQQRLK